MSIDLFALYILVSTHPHHPILILGGGLAGLSCGYHVQARGGEFQVYERASTAGGKASTDRVGEWLFDRTGHWLHLRDPDSRALVYELLEGELIEVERQARILSHGVFTSYPFQANTFGLPPAVIEECVVGFVESLRRRDAGAKPATNFEEYIQLHFGSGIARHFMIPYNTKIWGVHPREITAAWCSRFVPKPSLEEVVAGAVGSHAEGLGYNARFVYPRHGGIGRLAEAFAQRLGENFTPDRAALEIDPAHRRVRFDDGWHDYEQLVSSLPLPRLIQLLRDPPEHIIAAAKRLRWTTLAYVNYGCRGEVNQGHHWVYVPEERYPFYRVGSYSNAVPHLAPQGHSSLYVELSVPSVDVDWKTLLPQIRKGLVESQLIPSEDSIVVEDPHVIPMAYVVFDHQHEQARHELRSFLDEQEIHSIGRYGRWTYGSMEDAIIDGRETAASLR